VLPAPDELAEERLAARGSTPRPAETRYELERAFERHTLLRVRIITGVMHQIRVHLAHLGHPVAGDTQYGGEAAAIPGLGRHFLHAWKLALDAPGGGRIEVESPLPPELARFLGTLK
jgi:23S rRNA pseudouridine1911/1915/1917 synthase